MVKPLKRACSLTPKCGQARYRKERTCKTVEKKTSENVVTGVCPTCGDPGQIQGLLLQPEWAGTLKGDPCGSLSLYTHLGFLLQTQTVVHEPDGGSVLVTAMQWLMFCIIQVPPSGPLEQLVPPPAGSDCAVSHRCLSLYGLTCTRDKAPSTKKPVSKGSSGRGLGACSIVSICTAPQGLPVSSTLSFPLSVFFLTIQTHWTFLGSQAPQALPTLRNYLLLA